MEISRRAALRLLAGAPALLNWAALRSVAAGAAPIPMGVTTACYGIRWRASSDDGKLARFQNAVDLIEHSHELGAAGAQVGVGAWTSEFAATVRRQIERHGMYLEGQIRLPKDPSDAARFRTEVQTAKEAGASILRTVCLSGRRYETFDSASAFQEFTAESRRSLELAEPIVRKQGVRLAVENHKDWRVPELLGLLEYLGSESVGVCVDTGNSISLLEDPLEVVRAYAPWAVTTHFKDMGVREYRDGFLLSEVPLGEGFLDLPQIARILRQKNPAIRLNLEMITRDPLEIPCLTPKYWATFETLPGRYLADTLAMVRAHASSRPLPRVSGLDRDAHLALEEAHVQRSFAFVL